jgi:hypothetical protein
LVWKVWRYGRASRDKAFHLPYLVYRYGTGMEPLKKIDVATVTKEQVREMFPECVAFADEMRELFGPGVKVTYMMESGREVGTPTPKQVEVPSSPPLTSPLPTSMRRWHR